MKTTFLATIALILAVSTGLSQTTKESSFKPKDGFVPDAKTAVKIAEAVLVPVYGEKQIASERPFTGKLRGEIWTVEGTLNCAPDCEGGTAVVKISKTSGQILFMTHYK